MKNVFIAFGALSVAALAVFWMYNIGGGMLDFYIKLNHPYVAGAMFASQLLGTFGGLHFAMRWLRSL